MEESEKSNGIPVKDLAMSFVNLAEYFYTFEDCIWVWSLVGSDMRIAGGHVVDVILDDMIVAG